MSDNKCFYNPTSFGTWDLAISQQNKIILFSWDTQVIPESKVSLCTLGREIKTYTVGDGLTISNNNFDISLALNGADFTGYVGQTLNAQVNFFVEGDVEITFDLKIINSCL